MKAFLVDIGAEVERVRDMERIGAQLQAQRLRAWEQELSARDALLRRYLGWARKARVRPMTRREARKLGIGPLYRRLDHFWLVAHDTDTTSRGRRTTKIAGVYASGETIIRGFKAHQLAERMAQHVSATELPWGEEDPERASAAVALRHG